MLNGCVMQVPHGLVAGYEEGRFGAIRAEGVHPSRASASSEDGEVLPLLAVLRLIHPHHVDPGLRPPAGDFPLPVPTRDGGGDDRDGGVQLASVVPDAKASNGCQRLTKSRAKREQAAPVRRVL